MIDGAEVNAMHFYDDSGIVITHKKGWIGSNNDGNSALESLEFENRRRKRKLILDGQPFIMRAQSPKSWANAPEVDLYIPVAMLPGFIYHGEQEASADDTEVRFGNFITFDYGATKSTHEILTEIKPRRFMTGPYTRIERTERGQKLDNLAEFFKAHGIDCPEWKLPKLLTKKAELIDLLNSTPTT